MSNEERRQAWRVYVAAVSGDHGMQPEHCAGWADSMVEEERKRFDQPSHAGDADTMVEPKPWVGLTGEERRNIVNHWMSVSEEVVSPTPVPCDFAHLAALVEARLRYKNEGTR